MATGQTLPMLPWFARDYIAATRHLSLGERGAYTDLLFLSWEMGPLPDDPVRLARLIGVSAAEFKRVWPAIKAKFTKTPAGLINERLEKHRTKAADINDKRAAAGRQGAIRKWSKERMANAIAKPLADEIANGMANASNLPLANGCYPNPNPNINPPDQSARASPNRSKPVSAAVLLAQGQNAKSEGETGTAESAEAETLKRIVRDELSRGVSAAAIIRLMPGRGLTEEHIAAIAREVSS